jgi:hypothetical protein
MSSRSGELLDQGPDFFAAIITQLSEDNGDRPTPCAGDLARVMETPLGRTVADVSRSP